MSVRMPLLPPILPTGGEYFINQLVNGGTLQTLGEYANFLQGFHFRRCTPIIVRPFDRVRDNTVLGAKQTVYMPLRTDSITNTLFMAVGVSSVENDGLVEVEVREEPAEAAGSATPGSGAIIDPGCQWLQSAGDLRHPVENRRYTQHGLQWHTTGLLDPPDVDPIDPRSTTPRVLHVSSGISQELVIAWEKCALNSITLWEMYRPAV